MAKNDPWGVTTNDSEISSGKNIIVIAVISKGHVSKISK